MVDMGKTNLYTYVGIPVWLIVFKIVYYKQMFINARICVPVAQTGTRLVTWWRFDKCGVSLKIF